MRWWERAILGVALFWFAGCLWFRVEQPHRPIRVIAEPVLPPPNVEQLWARLEACSGIKPPPGVNVYDVNWYIFDEIIPVGDGDVIVGSWTPPDTILIRRDKVYGASDWVIAHELLHHMLRGPKGKDHPPVFTTCHLMGSQNFPEPHPDWKR